MFTGQAWLNVRAGLYLSLAKYRNHRSHRTPLGQFLELDYSVPKRLPTPNDTFPNSYMDEIYLSNATLLGANTILAHAAVAEREDSIVQRGKRVITPSARAR